MTLNVVLVNPLKHRVRRTERRKNKEGERESVSNQERRETGVNVRGPL